LVPLLWMVSASLMPAGEATAVPPRLVPSAVTLAHYRALFTRLDLARAFLNSAGLAAAVTVIALLVNSMAGYAFAKLRFAGRERLFRLLLAGLVVPAQVAMLPLFLMLKALRLVNTYAAVMIPGMASVFGIFVLAAARLYSLPVALASLAGEHVQDVELMMAGAVLTVLPVVLLFVGLQRYYIAGIMAGGVKE